MQNILSIAYHLLIFKQNLPFNKLYFLPEIAKDKWASDLINLIDKGDFRYEGNRNCKADRRPRESGYPQGNPQNTAYPRGRPVFKNKNEQIIISDVFPTILSSFFILSKRFGDFIKTIQGKP